ncbi:MULTISPECIES: glycosyltransferase family 25 protein [Parabacteroides]|uniref:Glycosyl transferase family 25 domain-containing protein n=1 Tax=Parabacteroides gordonii MS-1 = DSM 23371 TaxID=1203610 RepID=A0A0F5IPT2_9BACT|nr:MULTISPECIES: glycosyltransferase family 25 protein [Parabacteroides]KKB47564.1 hypothetical protein HMPREF1536_05208 [Parabacteroides gordonii MS-1 = DSM 23371]KKB49882.1 hypothetical protein HMPREF1212_03041 [Parabacteroides sp. HGS0025]MCA5584527.1 glycosyltransferase family 25 protein [Parabacteroides gordonii]RGP08771.1 hypothetical protein DXB27_24180 [Parabacteroides gordonii]
MEQTYIKTYVINLPKDTERRIYITKEISKIAYLDIEFVDAVDGRELGKEKLSENFDFKKSKNYQSYDLLLGEVGCTLSHLECYKKLLASDQEFALIVEDDIGFKWNEPYDDILKISARYIRSKKPLVLLNFAFFDYMGKGISVKDNYKIYKTYKAASATIYFINRQAANMIVSAGPPFWVADDWSLFRRKGIRIDALYPSFVYHNDNSCSSIGSERKKRTLRFPRSWMEFRVLADEGFRILLKKLGIMKHKEFIRYRE